MLTTHNPITTRDHLIDLARALTEADGQDPPDPARVGQLAWQILAELNEAAFGRIDAEALLAQAQTAARAAAADAASGSPDPLSHIRRLLAAQGGMPPAGTAATTILAWPGGRPEPALDEQRNSHAKRLPSRIWDHCRKDLIRKQEQTGRMPQTSVRLLRLLRLLQTPDDWTGPQLAEKLGVTTRTIGKDIERLRGLGYLIHAIPGTAGGYRADPRACVPVPGSLPVPGPAPALDAAVLTTIATACRDREQLRFDYTGQDDTSSYRIVEPYRLARARSHWYLYGWDTDRRDWRTFRADRIRPRSPNGPQFARRDSPDDGGAATRVLNELDSVTWRCQARVTVHAPADVIIQQLPPAITVEPVDEHTCVVSAGSDTPQILAAYLGMFDADFEVSEPPELVWHIRTLARRYKRAIAKAPSLSAG